MQAKHRLTNALKHLLKEYTLNLPPPSKLRKFTRHGWDKIDDSKSIKYLFHINFSLQN